MSVVSCDANHACILDVTFQQVIYTRARLCFHIIKFASKIYNPWYVLLSVFKPEPDPNLTNLTGKVFLHLWSVFQMKSTNLSGFDF